MQSSELIDTICDLVRIKSVNPAYEGGASEVQLQRYVSDFFEQHGIEVGRQEVLPGRSNVIARMPGRGLHGGILFEAHSDTVGVEGMSIPPFTPEIREGRIYGRGSCDTKAGMAAMMVALADLKRSGTVPNGDVWMASAVDEEHSCRGVLKLRENLEVSAAVVSEPTEMRMAVASKGCLRWRITVKGRSAHSSKPALGVNAIGQMMRVVSALQSQAIRLELLVHPLVGSPTLNVGIIEGGTQVNMVPETCWIEVDRRLIPGEDPCQVWDSYAALLDQLRSADPELRIEMDKPLLLDWPLETSEDSALVQRAARVLCETGLDPTPIGVPFGSDASKLAKVGIPAIILGPGSIDQAHTAEEHVEIEQVEMAFEVYRRLMVEFE